MAVRTPSDCTSPALESSTASQKRTELRVAVRDCRVRGLYEAAKWASEQLAGEVSVKTA